MAAIGLYYPWMHFQDPNWLKLALLTWDRLYRVRPAGIEDRDTDLVRQIRAESELIREASPSAADLESLRELFSDLVEHHFDELRVRYDIHRPARPRQVSTPWSNAPTSQAPSIRPPAPHLLWVYYGRDDNADAKMSPSLLSLLRDNNLARIDRRLPGRAGSAWRRGSATRTR